MPLRWEELDKVAPDQVRLPMVEERLKSNPWAKAKQIDLATVVDSVQGAIEDAGIDLEPFDRFRS